MSVHSRAQTPAQGIIVPALASSGLRQVASTSKQKTGAIRGNLGRSWVEGTPEKGHFHFQNTVSGPSNDVIEGDFRMVIEGDFLSFLATPSA